MSAWLLVWGAPAAALFALELWLDDRARRQPVMAAISAALWPVYIPLGVWVACNPKKAERIRSRFGTTPADAAKPSPRQVGKEEEMSENPYDGFDFEEARSAIVGGIRRENVEAVRSTARFFLRRFEDQRCDSEGVAECVRCQTVFIAKTMLEALEGVPTVSELARAHAEAKS